MNPMVSHEGQANSAKGNSLGSAAPPFAKGQFQDGGQNVTFGYKAREDGANSHGFGKSSQYNSHNLPPDSARSQSDTPTSMNDSMQSSSMANYNGNYSRSTYGMNDQHGGMTNTSTADYAAQNSQYNQYGQSSMRPVYPPGARGSPGPNRTGMPGPGMNMMGSNYPSGPQRFPMPGHSIQQQQGGPTPTLNQLLQNPNARYQSSGYGYENSMPKGNGDMSGGAPSGGPSFSQGWTGQAQRPPMNPYQQQMQQQGFRSQQGQMYNHGGSVGNPQQSGSFNHQYPYPAGNNQLFPPHLRQPNKNSSQSFNSQNENSQQSSSSERQGTPTENGDHEPSSSSQPTQQENSVSSNGGEDSNSQPAIVENGNGGSPQHPSVQALRPSPSPGPSSQQGSRSNTPASLTGQQSSSPMPRPPSNHSPMNNSIATSGNGPGPSVPPPPHSQHQPPQPHHQGYNNQGGPMMPPPVGSAAGPPHHQQPYNKPYQQYPPNMQGGYPPRYPGQGNSYPGMYPNASSMGGLPRPAGYPPYIGGPGMPPQHPPHQGQYYNDAGGVGGASSQGGPSGPSNGGGSMGGKGGAQQAAQAVVAAAESQSKGTSSPRPMESVMNGPRSSSSQNHTAENSSQQQQASSSSMKQSEDTNSIKSSASATRSQPVSPEESSQDSNTNQTMPDETDDEKSNDKHESTPSTPAPAASPSLSSAPEDSSSSWPGIPASQQPGTSSSSTGGARFGNQDVYARQCEMGTEPDRKQWLETLFIFMEEKGAPINVIPSISKNAVDLYKLYHLTKSKGGLQEVTKQKKWRDISTALNIGGSSSAGFVLKKNYCKFIFPYECRYDRDNVDPAPILAAIEAAQKKDSRKGTSASSSSNSNSNMGGMMPPNMIGNNGAGPGMYDQAGGGPPMMGGGGMQPDQYGNNGNNQYPGGARPMGNHYGNGPSTSAAGGANNYDNRYNQQGGYGGPPRPNDQYGNYPQQGGAGYFQGYQGQKQPGPGGMYKPGGPPSFPNAPYPPGPGGMPTRGREQWSADNRGGPPQQQQRGSAAFGGPAVPSTVGGPPLATSPGPTPPQYKQRMSPQRDGATPSTSAKPAASRQRLGQNAPRRDVVFPSDSVEATEARLTKRKRVTHRDLDKIDPWRLIMSLKSGQLAECTHALDVLNILTFDDHTVSYFGLIHMPGLLESIIEQKRHVLIEIFGAPFSSLELLCESVKEEQMNSDVFQRAFAEAAGEEGLGEEDNKENSASHPDGGPYPPTSWDRTCNVAGSFDHWQLGKGDTTTHIVSHMESERSTEFLRRKFLKRRSTTSMDKLRQGEEKVAKFEVKSEDGAESRLKASVSDDDQMDTETEEEEDNANEHDPISMLNDSGADVKDLITSIECNDKDKKLLDRLKRKNDRGDEESESYEHDAPPLCLLTDCQEELSRRVVCISNILRNLSFIPGNDREMSAHNGLLSLAGRLLLLHHYHPKRRRNPRLSIAETTAAEGNLDSAAAATETEEEFLCTSGQGGGNTDEWWWETLEQVRENVLVMFANISGHLNLTLFSEEICMPILDGLLHWSVCPSACARDPLPNLSNTSVISAHRLVLEALCKLCVTDTNVDLLLATPPFSRMVQLFSILVRQLADEDQVLKEFSVVLLSSLVAGGGSAARAVALQETSISLLLDFIEVAEERASSYGLPGGDRIRMLQDNPELMGTTLKMLRDTANTLHHLAVVPENRSLFLPQQNRLLKLVISQALDPEVSKTLASVLLLLSQPPQGASEEDEGIERG